VTAAQQTVSAAPPAVIHWETASELLSETSAGKEETSAAPTAAAWVTVGAFVIEEESATATALAIVEVWAIEAA
jgi:hypothetical protein